MNSLIKRSLTGISFVLIIVLAIIAGQFFYGGIFILAAGLTLNEFYRLFQKAGSKPLTYTGLIVGMLLFAGSFLVSQGSLSWWMLLGFMVGVVVICLVIVIFRKEKQVYYNLAVTFLGLIYVILPFSLLNHFAFEKQVYQKEFMLSFFVIIWSYDTFAYIIGSRIGKHKLAPKISPKKSWEGVAGGTIIAFIAGYFLLEWAGTEDIFYRMIMIVIILIGATLGDMSESLLKRNFQVKDSGNILPGHGGMLDRFDSVLLAAPFLYLYMFISGMI